MNDLRHDAAAQVSKAAGLRGTSLEMSLHYAERHDPDAHAIDARDLRTVPAPNLRSPDCRTSDDKLRAELVRIVDALQALTLRVDVLIEEQARTITELTAYIRDHSEAD